MASTPASVLAGKPSTPATGGDLATQYDALRAKGADLAPKTDDAYQRLVAQNDAAGMERDRKLKSVEDDRYRLEPPMPEKPKPMPDTKMTDPRQAWGSAAMFIAMFGSLLTRTPMNNALNAAAGVMNAFHKADLEDADRNFQKWQVESTNATKMFEYQNQAYTRVMAALDRRERMATSEYDSEVRSATQEARMLATSFKDNVALATLDMKGLDGLRALERDRQTHVDRMTTNAGKIQEQYEEQKAFLMLKSDPEYQAAEARGDYAHMVEMMRGADPHLSIAVERLHQQALTQITKQLDSSQSGKLYAYVETGEGVVAKAEKELKEHGEVDAQTQGQLIDFNNKLITNGQAIRKFMTELSQTGAPYSDQIAASYSKLSQYGGGHLAPHQAQLMLSNLKELVGNIKQQRNLDVTQAAEKMKLLGFDPSEVYKTTRGGPSADANTGSYAPPAGFKDDTVAKTTLGTLLGRSVQITSHGRSRGTNAAAGGSPTSEHQEQGPGVDAYDFNAEGMTHLGASMKLAAQFIKAGKPFDQILWEDGTSHIGWGPKNRAALGFWNKADGHFHAATQDDIARAYHTGEITRDEAADLLKHYLRIE